MAYDLNEWTKPKRPLLLYTIKMTVAGTESSWWSTGTAEVIVYNFIIIRHDKPNLTFR